MRSPTPDREQQDQHGLRHAPECDDPGVLQGSPDARGQGDGHQHAAHGRRCDDPSGRSDGPRHSRGKGPYGQQREERHESPRGQVAHEGAERQTRARAERDHLAWTPGALEGGPTRGVGTEGGGRGIRRGDEPQRRPTTIATPAAVRSASRGSSRVSSIVSPDRTTSPKARSHVTGVSLAGTPCRVASAAAAGRGAASADTAERPPSVLPGRSAGNRRWFRTDRSAGDCPQPRAGRRPRVAYRLWPFPCPFGCRTTLVQPSSRASKCS